MIKSNLVSLLKTFSPQEFKELGEFVSSPFYNKNPKVTELYNYIKKIFPDLDSPAMEKEKVFSKIYKGEKFRDSTLRLLMFYLYECAKVYLQVKRFKSNEINSNFFLISEFRERELLKETERLIKENTELIGKLKTDDHDYFLNRYLIDNEMLTLQERVYAGRYEKYMTGKTVEDLLKNLTDYYLMQTLRHYVAVLNTNEMYKTDFQMDYFRNILGVFSVDYFKDAPILEMYYYACRILEHPEDEDSFYKLKHLVVNEQDSLNRETLLDLFINLENYCVRRGREGKSKYDIELLDIYKSELEKKYYLHGRYMEHYFYKSVAATALIAHEFDWAENFVNEYKKELLPEYRDSVFYHCYAKIEIARKNYDKALECLSKTKFDEIYLKTESKLLVAVIYYELGIDDSLNSLLDTMRHFFKNDKFMAEERKFFYWDFVKILNKLAALKNKADKSTVFDIHKRIDETPKLYLKNWLMEKADEISG
jgi:hypothetical protein